MVHRATAIASAPIGQEEDECASPGSAPAIRRSFNASDINPILNDPYVFESIKLPGMKPGDVDASAIIENPNNVLLMAERGGIIFGQLEPGIYDVHTAFLKPERKSDGAGPHIRNACLTAYRWMFTHTDCMILQTKIPAFNRAAIIFAPLLGWRFEFERKGVWPTDDGNIDMSFFSLNYENWVRKDETLVKIGQAFHLRLDEEFIRRGVLPDSHPDEECHDRYVGACAQMIFGGQPEKAIVLYNRWARFAGYGQITMTNRSPLTIDIGTAILSLTGEDFEVVSCRQPR
jgi:hypothetical protein